MTLIVINIFVDDLHLGTLMVSQGHHRHIITSVYLFAFSLVTSPAFRL